MSPIKLVDGEPVEITEAEAQEAQASWEHYRGASGEPLGRKVTPDGTVLESDVPVAEDMVREGELQAILDGMDRVQVLTDLLSTPAGTRLVDMFVVIVGSTILVEDAITAGWTPPDER